MEGYILKIVPGIILILIVYKVLFQKHTREDGLRSRWERKHSYLKFNEQYNCAYCGKWIHRDGMQLDHVWPLHKGGKNWWLNLVPACTACNQSKRAKLKLAYLFLGYTYYPRLLLRVVIYSSLYILSLIHIVHMGATRAYNQSVFIALIFVAVILLILISIVKVRQFRVLFFNVNVIGMLLIGGSISILYNYNDILFTDYRALTGAFIVYVLLTFSNIYRHVFRILPGKNF